MSLTTVASSVKSAVSAELEKVQLPEGVEVSAELQQQFADAGVRGTLSTLAGLENANLSYITGSVEEGNDDVVSFTPAELLSEMFSAVNS